MGSKKIQCRSPKVKMACHSQINKSQKSIRKKAYRPQRSICLILWQLASIKFLVKCFYSTSSSMYTLFTAVERMALRADFYFNIMFRSRSGFKFIPASAGNFYSFVSWVNTFFHPLHLFLLNFPNCTLHSFSILFSLQLVNDFFRDFFFFCEKAWCSCRSPPGVILRPESAKRPARPTAPLSAVPAQASWWPDRY